MMNRNADQPHANGCTCKLSPSRQETHTMHGAPLVHVTLCFCKPIDDLGCVFAVGH